MNVSHARRRFLVIGAILAGVVLLAAYALRPEVIDVSTGVAVRGPMKVTVDEDGRTRVRNRFIIAAPVAGTLRRLTIAEGDRISQGQVVAWIAPLPVDSATRRITAARLDVAEAARSEALSRVGQVRVLLDQARRTEQRRNALYAAGGISLEMKEQGSADARSRQDELAAALAHARAADAEVGAAKAALASTYGRLAIPVRSPAAGRVFRIPERSERVITASEPIVEVGDAGGLEVVADVLSSDGVRIRPGNAAEIVEWGGEHALEGTVRSVEPSAFTRVSALGVDEQRVNVLVDIADPPVSLGDGFRVEIRVTVWEADDVLTIPSSALFRHGGGWAVFVTENGRAIRRSVTVGHRTGAAAEIKSGLRAGEAVILFPSDKVDDGTRVD